jgi:hypothetical protein
MVTEDHGNYDTMDIEKGLHMIIPDYITAQQTVISLNMGSRLIRSRKTHSIEEFKIFFSRNVRKYTKVFVLMK